MFVTYLVRSGNPSICTIKPKWLFCVDHKIEIDHTEPTGIVLSLVVVYPIVKTTPRDNGCCILF